MTENEISYQVIGAIYKVYNELGPGLLESVYEAALCYQLRKDGLKVENQVKLPVMYDGHVLPVDLRLDVLVEDKVIWLNIYLNLLILIMLLKLVMVMVICLCNCL